MVQGLCYSNSNARGWQYIMPRDGIYFYIPFRWLHYYFRDFTNSNMHHPSVGIFTAYVHIPIKGFIL